ncbi:MAG TPA: nucleotidyltransferase domain-containing protein [Gemmatimonadaceae bacterium]|nr:nucleotidyltransferase domain-containing protein [Gemmatimonadaceae bacterium]
MKDPRLLTEVAEHPHPLLFATVSGAHLYGFPSADSDFDLRGAHITPVALLTGLDRVPETIKSSHIRDGADVDLVTHEVRKFFSLLLRNNGYVLEQLYSPLVVHTTLEHEELRHIARGCITSACVRHYLGFAVNQWQLFEKESPPRLKPLLYVFRVLLSGIHMMRTGEVNANLLECNAALGTGHLPWVDDLVAQKVGGGEQKTLSDGDLAFYQRQYVRLREWLTEEAERSALPPAPTAKDAIADLLRRIRVKA